MNARLSILLPVLILAACTPQGSFPSLAKRPFESGATQPAPAPLPAPAAVSDAAALARIAASLDTARKSDAPFDAALAEARPAVAAAAGAAQGSERWIEGQLAASRIEPLLVPAGTALADLEDELRIAMTAPDSADRAAIEVAIAEAAAIVSRQNEAARALTDRLQR